jgi:hypothetical protein
MRSPSRVSWRQPVVLSRTHTPRYARTDRSVSHPVLRRKACAPKTMVPAAIAARIGSSQIHGAVAHRQVRQDPASLKSAASGQHGPEQPLCGPTARPSDQEEHRERDGGRIGRGATDGREQEQSGGCQQHFQDDWDGPWPGRREAAPLSVAPHRRGGPAVHIDIILGSAVQVLGNAATSDSAAIRVPRRWRLTCAGRARNHRFRRGQKPSRSCAQSTVPKRPKFAKSTSRNPTTLDH